MNTQTIRRNRSGPRSRRSPDNGHGQREIAQCAPVQLQDVLATQKLRSRRKRKPNSYQENVALYSLARVMAGAPDILMDYLLAMAMDLCNAGSAGLSVPETLPNGEEIFRWTHVCGELNGLAGGSTPRNLSACGATLELNAPQLFDRPARRFPYVSKEHVPIVEELVIPVYAGDARPGTLWVLSHNEEAKFDSEDVRLLTGLAEFASCALRLGRARDNERQALETSAAKIAALQQTEDTLTRSQSSLEEIVHARTVQLRQLSSRLMALQDEERRRIARELHDSVGQYLAGIQMNLHALQRENMNAPEAQQVRVKDMLSMTRLCLAEIRTISYLLHPPLLEEIGLASAISWYVDGFSERSGIKVQLEIPKSIGRFPEEMENGLFRVVQQSLSNIHRHSGSQVAKIRIRVAEGRLSAEICDEGRGIPAEILKGFDDGTRLVGVGMAGMRERIRDLGGLFSVRSGANGTTIEVRLPLPRNAKAKQSELAVRILPVAS